jgi:hypothetical protein
LPDPSDSTPPPTCGTGDCPTVFATERGTLAVQGYVVDHETPDGEAVVEIPVALLRETLPQYLVPQEQDQFTEFKANGTVPVMADEPGGWLETIRSAGARGARMRRVHVITEPLSPYLEFEFAAYYVPNSAAGEDIRILDLDLDRADPLDLPSFDYWCFDETDIVHMMYESDGTQTGRELLDGPDLDKYLTWRDLAWQHAVPFREYWDARP